MSIDRCPTILHFIPYELIGDMQLLSEALDYYYGCDGYVAAEGDMGVDVLAFQQTPEDLVGALLELKVLD